MPKQKGFSLIELLIVVAIILIIAAIAIPNLIRSKIASNNSAAAATIRTLNTAEATYNSTYQPSQYATLLQLGPGAASCASTGATSSNACIIDFTLGCAAGTSGGSCIRDQFTYEITVNNAGQDYVINAWPNGANQGSEDFCSAPDGVIRQQADPAATGTGPAGGIVATDAACQGGAYVPI
jgi:type IV pilus assembly protein PilA